MEEGKYELWMTRMGHRDDRMKKEIETTISNRKKRQLLDVFQSARNIYDADQKTLEECGILNEKEIRWMFHQKADYDLDAEWKALQLGQCRLTTIPMKDYPAVIKGLHDAPYGIFYKGELPEGISDGTATVAAVVGARSCSQYGKLMADDIAMGLAEAGFVVVSGMARGVDGYAHRGCINVGGKTIAVLGCGADVCYPTSNWELYDDIVKNGCVMSEFDPGTAPFPSNFPARNRIISGLASLTIVIEAKRKSGSLITADFALEQGREVYAVPGRCTDVMSEGCNYLIHQGAGIVTNVDQLLDDLQVSRELGRFEPREQMIQEPVLEKSDSLVYHCLDFYPKGIEQIQEESGLDLISILSAIVHLCEMRVVCECFQRQYIKLR